MLAFVVNKNKIIHNESLVGICYYDSPIFSKILALVCGADEKERLGVEGFTAIY